MNSIQTFSNLRTDERSCYWAKDLTDTIRSSYSLLLTEEGQDASTLLKTIKSLGRTLSNLANVVQEGLALAEEELLPDIYRHGINSLPFEVMEHIFRLLFDEGCDDFRPYMLVNRYFRDALKQASCLWTTVADFRDPSVFLDRSGSRSLHISMNNFSNSPNFDRYLGAVSRHRKRWRSLSIRSHRRVLIDNPLSLANYNLTRLREEYREESFPALETLTVDYGDDFAVLPHSPRQIVLGSDDPNSSIRSLFSTWDMPSLHRVEAIGLVPILPPTCLNNITSLRLRFMKQNRSFHNLGAIGDFLRGLHCLENLSLEIDMGDLENYGKIKSVQLPSLRVLKIVSGHQTYGDMAPLINALDVPKLRELDVDIEALNDLDAKELFKMLIDARFWMQLETLHCGAYILNNDCRSYALAILWRSLPRLHHLSIKAVAMGSPGMPDIHDKYGVRRHKARPPPLRTLRFVRCDRFTTMDVLRLGVIINAPEFEKLEMIECRNINSEIIGKVMPEGKRLECKEYDWSREFDEFAEAKPINY